MNIPYDLREIAANPWPSFAKSASLDESGTRSYYDNPATGEYRHADYLHARHVLGLDEEAKKERAMRPDLEWLARNVSEWPRGLDNKIFSEGGILWNHTAYGNFHEVETIDGFNFSQWLQARQDLGLVMTEGEAELPAEEYRRTAESFLRQAAELMKERGKQYDQPGGERSMGKAVDALNAITGRDLTEAEGWLLMSLVKRVRQFSGSGYHQDSAEDAVAYAALEAEALESSAVRARELEK